MSVQLFDNRITLIELHIDNKIEACMATISRQVSMLHLTTEKGVKNDIITAGDS